MAIKLDTVQAVCRLPGEKLQHLQEWVQAFLGKSKVTLKEVQLLLGHLSFACKVVVAGSSLYMQLQLELNVEMHGNGQNRPEKSINSASVPHS